MFGGKQNLNRERVENMSIRNEELISTLKSTKKANLANENLSHPMIGTAGTKASPVANCRQSEPCDQAVGEGEPCDQVSQRRVCGTAVGNGESVKKLAIHELGLRKPIIAVRESQVPAKPTWPFCFTKAFGRKNARLPRPGQAMSAFGLDPRSSPHPRIQYAIPN